MTEGFTRASSPVAAEDALRQDLARGDAVIESVAPVLRHLLSSEDHSVFRDEIVAATRGMLSDLARQLLEGLSAEGNPADRNAELSAALVERLVGEPELLGHAHALALEAQLALRLEARLGLDPVVSPLLQALLASSDDHVSALAMGLVAAQARFVQNQRRMQLPLAELPGDLLHRILLAFRDVLSGMDVRQDAAERCEAAVRSAFDESRSRLGLLSRLVTGMGGGATAGLSLGHAGAAIFLTALSQASGEEREKVALIVSQEQLTRLALALRAAGIKPDGIVQQLEILQPDARLQAYLEHLGTDQAATLLAQSALNRLG